jgi:hypothetical protein
MNFNSTKTTLSTVVGGLVILSGISLPIKSIAAPDPGNCTKSEWYDLNRAVSYHCKGSGSGNKCSTSMTPDELEINRNKFRNCATARDYINQACYNGGDSGHNEARDNARRAAERCESLMGT